MTHVAPASRVTPRERLLEVSLAIEPVLNRVVLAGPTVLDLLLDEAPLRGPRLSFGADATLRFLTTAMIDRLGVDLQRWGLARVDHSTDADRWQVSADVRFDLVQVRTDAAGSSQPWEEYATLLTLPFALDERLTVRIAGAPAMLALEFAAFEQAGARALGSEELERVLLLIAGRPQVEAECAAAPPEIRAWLHSHLIWLARFDALPFLIECALPESARLPELARRVRERVVRMAT